MADEFGYPTLTLPPNVGGRYSVFTPVGLLPLAVSGIDVKALLEGALQAYEDVSSDNNHSFETNPALCYASLRNILYKSGYTAESLVTWNPKQVFLAEWWKQLFGESDGKNNTGLLPISVTFSTDLHSMGQYFQEGERCLFATHLRVLDEYSLVRGSQKRQIRIPALENHPDGLSYMEGETLARAQTEAQLGTALAHSDGKLPTLVWELPEVSPWWLGYWMYMNCFACAVGGYARGINPFNQHGVESYKSNMLALMGQPELQGQAQAIRNRLNTGARLRSLGVTTK
jgi:glucose-6-phosphate isomerase